MSENDEMQEILNEFLIESYENLDQLDQDFIALEEDPTSKELLTGIFRTIHTIKGTCGFLEFSKLEKITHVGENLLSRLRDGEILLTEEITNALLALVDAVRTILASIENEGNEGDEAYADLIETLTRLKDGSGQTTSAPAEVAPDEAVSVASEVLEVPATPAEKLQEAAPEAPAAVPVAPKPKLVAAAKSEAKGTSGAPKKHLADTSIRVDVQVLDRLMNLVGELVLTRNQILQSGVVQEDASLHSAVQRLNLVTSELQEGIMQTRMQPIGTIWNKFPRVVRDLAHSCGKQVRVEMEGKETELDKSLIEAIKDPLTHLVRNSVDHGIEKPEVRKADGKPEEGCVLLRAYHESGMVNIEISDNGAGIEPERLKAKALERGVITAAQAEAMSTQELVNLIFAPGFSTAEKVTNVSGRGVGMDVVKTNIDRISGTLDVQSYPGEGTTIRIKIPLTLAIVPALVVASEGERFAIPQVSLVELIRVDESLGKNHIEDLRGTPVYRLRGNLLPIVYLKKELGLPGERSSGAQNIVVLQAGERKFGLVVDEIRDTEEIVVKPLGKKLKNIGAFAGATIMGDGYVALILDVLSFAESAHVISDSSDLSAGGSLAFGASDKEESQSLLLLRGPGERCMAMPLSTVSRLERFSRSKIERVGSYQVVQYRGGVLPLLSLSEAVGGYSADCDEGEEQAVDVVVYAHGLRQVGIMVDRIVVRGAESLSKTDLVPGEDRDPLIIQNRVTELLDIESIVAGVMPEIFHPVHALEGAA